MDMDQMNDMVEFEIFANGNKLFSVFAPQIDVEYNSAKEIFVADGNVRYKMVPLKISLEGYVF